jgi:hypothetical protein
MWQGSFRAIAYVFEVDIAEIWDVYEQRCEVNHNRRCPEKQKTAPLRSDMVFIESLSFASKAEDMLKLQHALILA